MTHVALETSTRRPSVAVRKRDQSLQSDLGPERRHASDLLPTLESLLQSLGSAPSDLESVVVGTGPGSYTGLRVGIATALGLARATGAALFGLPSIEALAYAELEPGEECVILMDARGGGLYFAHYRRLQDEVESIVEPCVVKPAELASLLPPGLPILGDATVARAAQLGTQELKVLQTDKTPTAQALLELGLGRMEHSGAMEPGDLEPLYLRSFGA